MIFDNFNSFTQTAGTKTLVSTMDLPEAEMVDVISLLKKLHGYSETDPETQEQAADATEDETETEEATDAGKEENDTVGTGYKLYCLTSNCSFSCGNLVPAACKSSGKVTLVGQTTGGGSCVVLPCTTAAGTVFQISGSMQISIIQNGSFYNTDSGIVPHFFLDKPESYYDRPALAEYLRELK